MKLINIFSLIIFFITSYNAQCQFKPHLITINLSPIVIENGKYYYDGRRVKFEDVVMPLIAVNDEQINQKLKVIQTLKDIRKPLTLAPILFYLYTSNNVQNAVNSFDLNRKVLIGSIAVVGLLDLTNAIIKRKIIKKYNTIVLQPRASLLPSNGIHIGIDFRF